MRIDELRSTLDEHGSAVDDGGTVRRVEAVHARIRVARRRRVAAAAGGTVVAVAAVALAVVPGLDSRAPGPVGDPTPSVAGLTKDGVTFRAEVLGERLLGAAIGDPGQSTVTFDFVVGEEGLRFSPLCYGPGPDLMVTYSVAGKPAGAVGCEDSPDPDPGAGGITYEAPPEKVLLGWGLAPGDTATMTVRLVSAEDSQGATVEDAAAVIGAGVYTDTRETRVVAGVEVPDRIEHDGRVWGLESTYESARSSKDVHILTGGRGARADTLVAVALSGLDSPSSWDIRRDAEVVDSGARGRGVDGPTWGQWRTFERGEVYDLRLVVTEGLTERTRLAFLSYTPVG